MTDARQAPGAAGERTLIIGAIACLTVAVVGGDLASAASSQAAARALARNGDSAC